MILENWGQQLSDQEIVRTRGSLLPVSGRREAGHDRKGNNTNKSILPFVDVIPYT